jgi:hypothetical protein
VGEERAVAEPLDVEVGHGIGPAPRGYDAHHPQTVLHRGVDRPLNAEGAEEDEEIAENIKSNLRVLSVFSAFSALNPLPCAFIPFPR